MTTEQIIAACIEQTGYMPSRENLRREASITQEGAGLVLREYEAQHPAARRAPTGLRQGQKLGRRVSETDKTEVHRDSEGPPVAPKTEWKQTGEAATIECRESSTIRTLEELLRVAGVDEQLWQCASHEVVKWDAVVKDGKENAIVQMFRVRAMLKRRSEVADLRRLQAETLAAIAAHAPAYGPILRPPNTGGHLLMLSPSDAHLGKLSWEAETGHGYDLQIAVDTVRQSIRTLTADALHHGLERIVLVVGNDLLHANDSRNATYAGTQLDVSNRFWEVFAAARDLMVGEIEWLTQWAAVTVITTPGNHGLTAEHHLGALLEAWFRGNPDVTVDASPKPRKYHRHGAVLLGFAHGHEEKHGALPQIMAAEQKTAWAETTCREWITGHLHRKGSREYAPLVEDGGVTVRVMPALCSADYWSTSRGYLGQAAGQAIVYSRAGLRAQYHHTTEAK